MLFLFYLKEILDSIGCKSVGQIGIYGLFGELSMLRKNKIK